MLKTFIFLLLQSVFCFSIFRSLVNNEFTDEEEESKYPSLWTLLSKLQECQYIDLTHSFDHTIPHWKGVKSEIRTPLYYYDEGVGTDGFGFFIQRYDLPGQWGTHVDSPAHFIKGKRFIDEIVVKEMILPLVLFDVSEKVKENPDYCINMEDVRQWEAKSKMKVPQGAFAVLRTDWSKRWPNATLMENIDEKGIAHYPGWSLEVLKYLYEERNVTATGHETLDTDPGIRTSVDDYSLENYVLDQNKYQIELLVNLDKVPEKGAIAVVTFPKPKKGSGFPARVFAIIPNK